MTTLRVNRRNRYTTIDQRTINDARLSYRARGILTWLLDKPDDWRCDSETIAAEGLEGRGAVRAALTELENQGYLRRTKVQDRETGHWSTVVDVFERPTTGATQSVVTEDRFPVVGQPDVGEPTVGGPVAIPKTKTKDYSSYSSSDPVQSTAEEEKGSAEPSPLQSAMERIDRLLREVCPPDKNAIYGARRQVLMNRIKEGADVELALAAIRQGAPAEGAPLRADRAIDAMERGAVPHGDRPPYMKPFEPEDVEISDEERAARLAKIAEKRKAG